MSTGWSDVAVKAAQGLAVSQREALKEVSDIKRSVTIRGELIRTADQMMKNDVNAKIIHFQRHGQGWHNLIGDTWREFKIPLSLDSPNPGMNPFVRPEMVDSPLTELGRLQSMDRRPEASLLQPELVVVSPLQRAIQTARISFQDHLDIPWIAHEGCREELGLLLCNKRRKLSEIKHENPHIDYSLMQDEDDSLFYDGRRETALEKADRVYDFLADFIRNRPEREIVVVGHSAWLFAMCNAVMDCGDDEQLQSWFLTSEIRSLRVSFEDSKEEQ